MRRTAPTARTAWILALIALSALVAPLWLPAACALALLTAALVDAWFVREAPALDRSLHPVISLGAGAELLVRARAHDNRDVRLRQPATPALSVETKLDRGELSGTVSGRIRGRHTLPGVACASIGPLGLSRVHHRGGEPVTVTVYPDLVTAKAQIARLRRSMAAHAGRAARGSLGLGTEFESIREYSPDDDIRQLNWRASARLGRPMSNQYRLERDRDVVCLVDGGRLMSAPIGVKTLLDVALDAVTVLAMAANELGDRCGFIAFDDRIRVELKPTHRGARKVIEALLELEPRAVESDFERAFALVGSSRRALVVVFTDLVDEAAARSLLAAVPMLARRHALLIASAGDPSLQERLSAASTGSPSEREIAAAVVAHDVLQARAHAAVLLRRSGAVVLEAPADQLGARCLDAYLDAKSRMRV